MKRTPQQTYLAERLHAADGLGWQMNQSESAWHGLFRFVSAFWARIASLSLLHRQPVTR